MFCTEKTLITITTGLDESICGAILSREAILAICEGFPIELIIICAGGTGCRFGAVDKAVVAHHAVVDLVCHALLIAVETWTARLTLASGSERIVSTNWAFSLSFISTSGVITRISRYLFRNSGLHWAVITGITKA